MTTKTIATKSGKTITVELVRYVQDKIVNLDGDRFVTGREIVEYTNISFCDDNGKVIAKGREMVMLSPNRPDHKALIAKGAVASVGNAYLTQENANIVTAAIAELNVENPKSDEQLAIEAATAKAQARWEADLPAIMEAEALDNRMSDPNSDY